MQAHHHTPRRASELRTERPAFSALPPLWWGQGLPGGTRAWGSGGWGQA